MSIKQSKFIKENILFGIFIGLLLCLWIEYGPHLSRKLDQMIYPFTQLMNLILPLMIIAWGMRIGYNVERKQVWMVVVFGFSASLIFSLYFVFTILVTGEQTHWPYLIGFLIKQTIMFACWWSLLNLIGFYTGVFIKKLRRKKIE